MLKTPEQLSFANDVVITISDLAYFRGPSEYKVFLFVVALMGMETIGGLHGALVTRTTNSQTTDRKDTPSACTVTAFDTSAVTL